MNKKILSYLQYVFFLALAIFLVWWSIRKIPAHGWVTIRHALANANYWLIGPVMVSLLLSHYSRARRWKILMEPLGYNPRMANTYLAVLIGYFANLAAPRLGEVLKCTILARYEKVPADKLVGTIVAERAFDVLCLGVVILITILIQFDVIGGYVSEIVNSIVESKANNLSRTTLIILAAIVIFLVLLVIFIFKRKSHLAIVQKTKKVFQGIWRGITSVRYLKNKGWFLFHTVFIWSMYLLSVRLGLYALQETSVYGIKEAFSILTTGSLAMIVPVSGQGLGVYPLAVQKTLMLYGSGEVLGFAFGTIMWSVQFFLILLSGFVALILLPYLNKQKPDAKS
jgi:uncharacterized membrane protein YbhN (UPF0104 family)